MKTSFPVSAIAFDSAKLQRLGVARPSPFAARSISLSRLREHLGQQLQTSLEPQRILGLFFREIQRLVPLDTLIYQHKPSDLRLEFGQRGRHALSYDLSHEGEHLGELVLRRN
jgi:hypothetical protein